MAMFYWIVPPAAVANPTGAQIVAGLNGAGAAAIASGSVVDTGQASPVDAAADVTGLSPGTSYEVAWVHDDALGTVVIAAVTTARDAAGSLASSAAAVAGTAAHLTLHTSTGALSAQAATVSGTALHPHTSTGVLGAGAATVAGTATHGVLHESSGALTAAAATVAGTVAHEHAATGSLASDAATVAGSAARLTLHTAEGAIAAGPATVAGSALHIAVHDSSGDLEAQSATVAGSAVLIAAGASTPAAIWNYVLSNGLTAEQNLVQNNEMLRIIMAGIAGQSSGVGTDTETYYGADHTTPRIIATFDAAGNRVTVVTDGSP